jgi:hypothetical protein
MKEQLTREQSSEQAKLTYTSTVHVQQLLAHGPSRHSSHRLAQTAASVSVSWVLKS